MSRPYLSPGPTLEELTSSKGLLLIEFGTAWCGHCQAAQQYIEQTVNSNNSWDFIKIEDGPGKRVGRFFKVKLWPTCILLQDGKEIGRAVRPSEAPLALG